MVEGLAGTVAFVTGAARGQGRAFALRLAEAGADLILVDLCAEATSIDYAPATERDLEETLALVQATGRRAEVAVADVRDFAALSAAVDRGCERFGRLDVVVANAGVVSWGRFWELTEARWRDMIDICLTGTFNTFRAAAPRMIEAGNGGSIIAISSAAGLKAYPGIAHYTAAKHGVVGLVKSAAIELAPYGIRVNSIHPWAVATHMGVIGPEGQAIYERNPSYAALSGQILSDPPMLEPDDVANAVLFLAAPGARGITAAQIPVDQGASKF